MDTMRNELRHIGLVDEEVNVYLYLLKSGASKAFEVAKALSVARTTVYRFLESLISKGLVSERIEGGVKVFVAVDPERIPDILEDRIGEIREVLPELKKIYARDVLDAGVELYKGKEGIKVILNDIFRENKDYVFMGESQKFFDELEFFSSSWVKRVDELKVKGKLLCPEGQEFEVTKNEVVRYLDPKLVSNTSVWIYGDKVAQFIWDEPFYVVLIKSKSVAEAQMKVFEFLWGMSEEIKL